MSCSIRLSWHKDDQCTVVQHHLPVLLGRGAECDLRWEDPQLSRKHLKLFWSEQDDAVVARDLASANGTLLNGRPLQQAPVFEGDAIQIGGVTATILEITDPQEAPAAPKEEVEDTRPDLADRIYNGVIERVREDGGQSEALSDATLVEWAEEIGAALASPEDPQLAGALAYAVSNLTGLGSIEPLLHDDSVSEIMVNGPDQVFVERNGVLMETTATYPNDEAVMRVIERIVRPLGRRIDEASPMVDGRLPDGSRIHAVIPPLSLNGPTLTIRRFRRQRLTVADLMELGALSEPMANFLIAGVRDRASVLVSGGTGTGKTTLLNVLSDAIPESERIISIEDAAELQLSQGHVVRLEARPANAEGAGGVDIRELVRNALRMRPDRIIVGECRGPEALDMLQAMNTGHEGSLTTVHANSPRDAVARLETMCLMANLGLPHAVVREYIVRAIDLIVQLIRTADGTRRIVDIAAVHGLEGDTPVLQELFRYDRHNETFTQYTHGDGV